MRHHESTKYVKQQRMSLALTGYSPSQLQVPDKAKPKRVHFQELKHSGRASARTKQQARDFEMHVSTKEMDPRLTKLQHEPAPIMCKHEIKRKFTRKQRNLHN